jgi:hypothetical protein
MMPARFLDLEAHAQIYPSAARSQPVSARQQRSMTRRNLHAQDERTRMLDLLISVWIDSSF